MKRELLDNGNIWQKSDGRWIGLVRYKDEFGVAQRKSFSSKKKKTLQAKMTEYVKNFNEQVANSDESRKPLKESMVVVFTDEELEQIKAETILTLTETASRGHV